MEGRGYRRGGGGGGGVSAIEVSGRKYEVTK